ncbi:hypothetical protein [Akkermansia muciniphila]|uniref:hypothetical protein n=2 Tax=Akkermansia muciniphila TaxID=239935 RepID=UPI0011E7215F|nr:hypothetical protein [Akkermansia muciniphila]
MKDMECFFEKILNWILRNDDSWYATCIGSMLNIDGGLLIRNATFHMKIKMDAKIIFHPFPIPEQTMQQNNTFREFHLSYIEKEGVLFARSKFGAKTRNRSSS